jgi:hypothetical protein
MVLLVIVVFKLVGFSVVMEWKSELLRNRPTCSAVGRRVPSTTEIARSNPGGLMCRSCKLSPSAETEDSSVS